MLDSPKLIDETMVCGSNTDQKDHFSRIQLVVIPLFRDTSDLYPYFFPLIHPRKVIHNNIIITIIHCGNNES